MMYFFYHNMVIMTKKELRNQYSKPDSPKIGLYVRAD